MTEAKKDRTKSFSNNVLFFVFLTVITIIASGIGSLFHLQATYTRINPVTGGLERNVIAIENLISLDGIRFIFGNAITNFVSFAPLGMLIVSLMGIGVAYKSGLLTIVFGYIGRKLSRFWITFIVVILGIISSFGGEIGYVLLIPLAPVFFLVNHRNPIIGIFVAFISIASGYGISLFATNLDFNLIQFTEMAAGLIDKDVTINIFHNIYFITINSIILALFITYITEKIVVPRMPKYKHDDDIIDDIIVSKKEKRGLLLAIFSFTLLLVMFIWTIVPNMPLSGILLDKGEATYLGKLFGPNSYFLSSLVYIIAIMMIVCGWLYGLGARTIKNSNQFSMALYESLNNIGNILVLIFLASQFVAIFRRTNLGMLITIWLMDIIETLNFTSLSLIILFFIFVGIANIFLPSSVTKWAILSPVIVPMFMKSNITPQFTQAIFRISDSATNIVTPVLAYFVIFVGFVELYSKGENAISIRKCYSFLWIYTVGITFLWLFIIIAWYIIGTPIGVNVFPTV
jgi:aminobenzoyl-glutamate transport protein